MTTEQTIPMAISCRGVKRTYGTGREAFEAVRGVDFDVPAGSITALLGTNGAGKTSTVELLEGLAAADGGEIRILGLDPWREREVVRRSAVRGFLPKTTEAARLAEVIRAVASGGRYVDPELAAEAIGAGESPLTPREADCLELAADGAKIEDIAAKAHLSPGTVRNYVSSAITKLGAANRHDACAIASRMGWI